MQSLKHLCSTFSLWLHEKMSVVVTHIVGRVCKGWGRPEVVLGLMTAGDVIKVLERVCGQVPNG